MLDRNAYEREAVTNKNSDQMITSDKKSYARESITTKKLYQRKEEKGRSENKILNPHKHVRKKQKCENARNQNSDKDVEKNHTCVKVKNQDSHKDVENKCMCENVVNLRQHKHVKIPGIRTHRKMWKRITMWKNKETGLTQKRYLKEEHTPKRNLQ